MFRLPYLAQRLSFCICQMPPWRWHPQRVCFKTVDGALQTNGVPLRIPTDVRMLGLRYAIILPWFPHHSSNRILSRSA